MKNKEIEELLNEFKKGTHLFPEYREIILSYIEQLENNRDKAIKYIEKHTDKLKKILVPQIDFNYKELLNILKGDSDENK